MTWPDFFVLCLTVGFIFSLLSAVSGALHLPHFHLPHFHFHAGGVRGGTGPLNAPTVAGFLMWFGAAGYLLARFADWRLLLVVGVAGVFGLMGAGVVFWFLTRVMLANERPLNPMDFDLTGMLGHLSATVRPKGTGEMIFVQEGRRRGIPVRTETGEPLARGTEVIVTRYEGGIAYVRTWDEMQSL
jgi:membrane protein implicated in regulation of membrane protease activity